MSLFPRALAPCVHCDAVRRRPDRGARPPTGPRPAGTRLRGGAAAAADARARAAGPAPRCPGDEGRRCSPTAPPPRRPTRPTQVKQAIWAANSLQDLPYRYGGGHNLQFDVATGADCSGTVSFALHAAGLLKTPLDSGSFMRWGAQRQGRLDHRLHEPRPRVRDDRRPAARHERRRHEPRARRIAALGVRERPALAPDGALAARLRQAPPALLLALRRRSARRRRRRSRTGTLGAEDPNAEVAVAGHGRTHVHRHQGEDQQDARQGGGPVRDARVLLREADGAAAERQEGHRRRRHREEAAPAPAAEARAAGRQARHAGAPGARRRAARTSPAPRSSASSSPRPSCRRSTSRSPSSSSSSRA